MFKKKRTFSKSFIKNLKNLQMQKKMQKIQKKSKIC